MGFDDAYYADMISIHALREEGDKNFAPPLQTLKNFYPRPPRGGRQVGLGVRTP